MTRPDAHPRRRTGPAPDLPAGGFLKARVLGVLGLRALPPGAALLCAVLLCAALAPAPARADGCLLPVNTAADIAEPEQKAVVVFDAGREDLVLQVRYAGDPAEFGWLVPLPALPVVTPVRDPVFEWLSRTTQEPHLASSERVARVLRGRTRSAPGLAEVAVIRRDTLGVYDTVTLAADRGEALAAWLAAHDFRAPAGAGPVLESYARRHWYFVAMRIVPAQRDSSTAARLAGGTLQAMRFAFDTERPVFPLRISALGGAPSELLIYTIARQQLVPVGGGPVTWQALHCGPGFAEPLAPVARFPGLDFWRGEGVVSKLRATFRPEEMDDLTFAPYDPRADLAARDARTRAMAASCAGRQRNAACLPGLLNLLKQTWWPGPDAVPALWALGRIGGPEATACLLRWADGFSTLHRVEAMEALAGLGEKRALPLFLAGVRRWGGPHVLDPWAAEETKAALEHLIALGDESCLPAVRRLAARRADPDAWEKEFDERPAIGLVAAQAACGDEEARGQIVRAIVRQGRGLTELDTLVTGAERGGSINGYPTGFWIGDDILNGGLRGGWFALRFARQYLQGRPDVLDPLLRRAAADSTLPDAGRLLLRATLHAPQAADLDSLDALLARALRPGVRRARIPLHAPGIDPAPRPAFNMNACCVAYAYGRYGACARLERLWHACPADDRVLRAEIALAAARSDSLRLLPIVVEYLRTDWNAAARRYEPAPPLSAGRGLAPAPAPRPDPPQWLDFEYRARPLIDYLNGVAAAAPERQALLTDATLEPLLRAALRQRLTDHPPR